MGGTGIKVPRLLIAILICVVGLVSCDADPVCVCPEPVMMITGSVSYTDSLKSAEGALVYLSYDNPLQFSDTVRTDARGIYLFEDVGQGSFYLFAGITDDPESNLFSFISPVSAEMDNTGINSFSAGNLFLYQVSEESVVAGNVISLETDPPGQAVPNADVYLRTLSYYDFDIRYTTSTDPDGNYTFTDVETGTYWLYAQTLVEVSPVHLIFCDGISSYSADTLVLQIVNVEKPAIYIYPDTDSDFLVELEFMDGTTLTSSIPEYSSGWDVFVETTGLIDHQYDYLFYEVSIREVPELLSGWSLSRDELDDGLQDILTGLGFNQSETDDFLDYWLGRLMDHEYYSVYPASEEIIDRYVGLNVIPAPDTKLRFWLFFKGEQEHRKLPEPVLTGFERGSTTVIEWGGILLP
jgi:hypothetical protein